MDEEARKSSLGTKHIQQGPYDTPFLPYGTARPGVGEHVCHASLFYPVAYPFLRGKRPSTHIYGHAYR